MTLDRIEQNLSPLDSDQQQLLRERKVSLMASAFGGVRPLSTLGLVLAAGVVSGFWGTRWLERVALTDLLQASAQRPATIVLSGRKMPPSIFNPDGSTARERNDSGARLLVVVSDNCPACRSSLPGFERLFDSIAGLGRLDVHIQSLSGSEVATAIAGAAQARGINAVRGMVGNITEFSTATGIRAVPTTLALGPLDTVIASARELPDEAVHTITSALRTTMQR